MLCTYSYDGAGNTATETRPGESFAYGYNNRNRLTTVTRNGVAYASYGYNGMEQMISRSTTAIGGPSGVVHYVYDLDGHLIAEADGATGITLRDYIWLPANDNRNADRECQESCARGHSDHKERITWLSRKTYWTSFWLGAIPRSCLPRTACWMN